MSDRFCVRFLKCLFALGLLVMAICAAFTDWMVSKNQLFQAPQVAKLSPDAKKLPANEQTSGGTPQNLDVPQDAARTARPPSRPPAPPPASPPPAPRPPPPLAPRPVPPPPPPAPPPGVYKEEIYVRKHECVEQAMNFGSSIPNVQACDEATASTPECGVHFMFSKSHPDWACRCCAPLSADDGPPSEHWDVYKLQTPRPKTFAPVPTLPASPDPFSGLPMADVIRPDWLLREDGLVVDARDNPEKGGGILILQAVLQDKDTTWGRKSGLRPPWLKAILETNKNHAIKHKHVLVVRAQPTQPQLTKWQVRQCGKKSTLDCVKQNERENYNWEKHLMVQDYLLHPQNFSHVLMLDADAALVKPDVDTLRGIAGQLEDKKKDLFLTDEDWLQNGAGRINGGLMFSKNTAFTRALFQDTFQAHIMGPAHYKNWKIGVHELECSSNEQICLNDLWQRGHGEHFAPFAMMASGLRFNRGAEPGIYGMGIDHIHDPDVEIMHWMGGSKPSATRALCHGKRDLTGGGPNGYGCKGK